MSVDAVHKQYRLSFTESRPATLDHLSLDVEITLIIFPWRLNTFQISLQVSWVRHRDVHLLTVGHYTYTSDQRFRAIHQPHSEDWTLQIKYPQHRDSGIYECQVSSTPHLSHFIHLTVIGKWFVVTSGNEKRKDFAKTSQRNCLRFSGKIKLTELTGLKFNVNSSKARCSLRTYLFMRGYVILSRPSFSGCTQFPPRRWPPWTSPFNARQLEFTVSTDAFHE